MSVSADLVSVPVSDAEPARIVVSAHGGHRGEVVDSLLEFLSCRDASVNGDRARRLV